MEFLQNVRWMFTAAGVLLVIAAIFEGGLEIREIKIPELHKGARIVAALAGVGFIALGILPIPTGIETPAESVQAAPPEIKPQIQVAIDSPQPGEEVPDPFMVKGTVSSPVPEGYSLWILMEDDDGDHYDPQAFKPLPDGRWEQRIRLGPTWHGREGSILVVQVEGKPALEKMLQNQEDKEETRNVFELNVNVELLEKRTVNITGD